MGYLVDHILRVSPLTSNNNIACKVNSVVTHQRLTWFYYILPDQIVNKNIAQLMVIIALSMVLFHSLVNKCAGFLTASY